MKIRLTLEEVEEMVRESLSRKVDIVPKGCPVRFMHHYADQSGEIEINGCGNPIDYIEVDLDHV